MISKAARAGNGDAMSEALGPAAWIQGYAPIDSLTFHIYQLKLSNQGYRLDH